MTTNFNLTASQRQEATDLGTHLGQQIVRKAIQTFELTDAVAQDLIIATHAIGAMIGVLAGVLSRFSAEQGHPVSPEEAVALARQVVSGVGLEPRP